LVDGEIVGTAPLAGPVEVDAERPHVVIARRSAEETTRTIPAPGNDSAIELSFVSIAPDGAPRAAPPAPPASPASTASPVSAASSARSPAPNAVTVPPRGASTGASPRSSALRTWMTVGLGVGAAALAGAGLYMGMQSGSDGDDADRLRGGMSPNACRV